MAAADCASTVADEAAACLSVSHPSLRPSVTMPCLLQAATLAFWWPRRSRSRQSWPRPCAAARQTACSRGLLTPTPMPAAALAAAAAARAPQQQQREKGSPPSSRRPCNCWARCRCDARCQTCRTCGGGARTQSRCAAALHPLEVPAADAAHQLMVACAARQVARVPKQYLLRLLHLPCRAPQVGCGTTELGDRAWLPGAPAGYFSSRIRWAGAAAAAATGQCGSRPLSAPDATLLHAPTEARPRPLPRLALLIGLQRCRVRGGAGGGGSAGGDYPGQGAFGLLRGVSVSRVCYILRPSRRVEGREAGRRGLNMSTRPPATPVSTSLAGASSSTARRRASHGTAATRAPPAAGS